MWGMVAKTRQLYPSRRKSVDPAVWAGSALFTFSVWPHACRQSYSETWSQELEETGEATRLGRWWCWWRNHLDLPRTSWQVVDAECHQVQNLLAARGWWQTTNWSDEVMLHLEFSCTWSSSSHHQKDDSTGGEDRFTNTMKRLHNKIVITKFTAALFFLQSRMTLILRQRVTKD